MLEDFQSAFAVLPQSHEGPLILLCRSGEVCVLNFGLEVPSDIATERGANKIRKQLSGSKKPNINIWQFFAPASCPWRDSTFIAALKLVESFG
jgi:hypothetical protein